MIALTLVSLSLYQTPDACDSDLQAYAEDKKCTDTVDDHFTFGAEMGDHSSGIEIEDIDQYADKDDGQQYSASADQVVLDS